MPVSHGLGTVLVMTSSRMLLVLPAAAGLLVLSACGSDDVQETAEAGASSVSSAASSAGAGASSAASSASTSVDGGSSAAADIEFEDQSGGGDAATIARVSAPEAGFVVVRVDDDDRSDDGTLLGSTSVEAGVSSDVEVSLDPPLDGQADLEATLYADTNGNGSYDDGADQAVAEPEDGDDSDDDGDDTDVVDDGAEYSVS